MYLKPVYDHRFFAFLAQLGVATKNQRKLFTFISKCLRFKAIQIPLILFERLIALIISLPIPIYSNIIYVFIKSVNGYFGYYIRSIYYSNKARNWAGNIIIEEDVILENISNYEFDEFVMIDKKVIVGASSFKIGKGCHIAMGTMISKGGEVVLEDFSAISYGCILIAASDSPDNGHRTSGPMIPNDQRNITVGKIILKKDSWVTSNVVVMPNTIIGEGAIVPPNSVISKNVKDWKIRLIEMRKEYIDRERIKFPEPRYE
jgi:acetyltransferase-like isoleucine patch superfamily enzyme